MRGVQVDDKDKELLMRLQDGVPVVARPYEKIGKMLGISENEVISRVKTLKKEGFIKRIDFRLDLKRVGVVSTLVGCKIPEEEIPGVKGVISNCKNVTHNYLRRHNLNMWFTLSAQSKRTLKRLLKELRGKMDVKQLLDFETKKTFKLGFGLDVK